MIDRSSLTPDARLSKPRSQNSKSEFATTVNPPDPASGSREPLRARTMSWDFGQRSGITRHFMRWTHIVCGTPLTTSRHTLIKNPTDSRRTPNGLATDTRLQRTRTRRVVAEPGAVRQADATNLDPKVTLERAQVLQHLSNKECCLFLRKKRMLFFTKASPFDIWKSDQDGVMGAKATDRAFYFGPEVSQKNPRKRDFVSEKKAIH